MIKEPLYSEFVEEFPVRDWIDSRGREVLSNTPRVVNLPDYVPPSSILDLMNQLYRSMADMEVESPEEADDFDVPDELGIEMKDTPYEMYYYPRENSSAAGTPEADPSVPSPTPEPLPE